LPSICSTREGVPLVEDGRCNGICNGTNEGDSESTRTLPKSYEATQIENAYSVTHGYCPLDVASPTPILGTASNVDEADNAEDSTPRPLQLPFSQAQTPLATGASDDEDTPRPLRNAEFNELSAVLEPRIKSFDEDAVTGGYLDWSWESIEVESTVDFRRNTKQNVTLTSYGYTVFAAMLFLLSFPFLLLFFLPDFYGQAVDVGLRLEAFLIGIM